jgi:hypothetical protein
MDIAAALSKVLEINAHGKVLGRALGHIFLVEIAPGIVDVAVTSVFCLMVGKCQ